MLDDAGALSAPSDNDLLYSSCLKCVVRGAVPIKLSLVTADSSSSFPATPVHLLGSRYAYLSEAAKEAVAYFRSIALEFEGDVWFEYNGSILKR